MPNAAITASPANFSTIPPCVMTQCETRSKNVWTRRRTTSGSAPVTSAVESTRSTNRTVASLRSIPTSVRTIAPPRCFRQSGATQRQKQPFFAYLNEPFRRYAGVLEGRRISPSPPRPQGDENAEPNSRGGRASSSRAPQAHLTRSLRTRCTRARRRSVDRRDRRRGRRLLVHDPLLVWRDEPLHRRGVHGH